MIRDWKSVIETSTNVALLLASVAVLMMFGIRYFAPTTSTSLPPTVPVGEALALDFAWKAAPKTLVLALNKDCQFCTNSADFYRRLVAANREEGSAQLLAVFPHDAQAGASYLRALNIGIASVLSADPAQTRIAGTPTLVLVDQAGVVRRVWRGQLNPAQEQEVISAIVSD